MNTECLDADTLPIFVDKSPETIFQSYLRLKKMTWQRLKKFSKIEVKDNFN